MKKSINILNQDFEIEKFNIIFASDTIIEDWFYDSADSPQFLLFNNIWEPFKTKIPKNIFDLFESLYSIISESNAPFNFIEYIKFFYKIKQDISLLESLKKSLIKSTISDKNKSSEEQDLVKIKRKHIVQIVNILKKYKESIQQKAGPLSAKDIEAYMKKKEDFNNMILSLYNILSKTISKICEYCSFNNSEDPNYFEKMKPVLTSLYDNFTEFDRNIKEFQESTENYSNFIILDTLIALFKRFNEKISRIEDKPQINDKIRPFSIKTLGDFNLDINKLYPLQLGNVPKISRLSRFEDIESAWGTLLQQTGEIKEYYSEILQKIQLNTPLIIKSSNITELLFENTEQTKPLINLINEPFQNPELIKVFCSKLAIYEGFVQSIQTIHNLVSKFNNIFQKIYSRILSISTQIDESSQSLLDFDTERQKKIKFIEEIIAHEDQIIQNEERLLLFLEGATEKVELKNAFKSYHQEVDAVELRIQSEENSKNTIDQLYEQIAKENSEISTILKNKLNKKEAEEEFIKSYHAFASFFENIVRSANRGLKELDLYLDFSFKLEHENHHVSPVLNPIFLKKGDKTWLMADPQTIMQSELIKEIILFSIVLNLSKIEIAKNRIFAYYFDSDLSNQDRERLNKMVKSIINQEDIKKYVQPFVLFFNNERTFEATNENIKIIHLEEESE